MQVFIDTAIEFYASSQESIESFVGDIGYISEESFIIPEGSYDIDISIDKMIDFSNKHEIEFSIKGGKVYLD